MGEAVIACLQMTMAAEVARTLGIPLREAAERVTTIFIRHLNDAPTLASLLDMIDEAVAL